MKGGCDDVANSGAHQHRSADGGATLSQEEYIAALILIRHVGRAKSETDELSWSRVHSQTCLHPSSGPLPTRCSREQRRVAADVFALQRARKRCSSGAACSSTPAPWPRTGRGRASPTRR
eukprot:1155194-Pyramimonas_sp.AAC.1